MGRQLIAYFKKVEALGGLKAKMRLAIRSCISYAQAEMMPDDPDKVVIIKAAFEKIVQDLKYDLVKFEARQVYDVKKMRHYLNGEHIVFHCHHYTALFTQLADDAVFLNGAQLLREASQESLYPILVRYYEENNISFIEERISIAEQYYSVIGLGKVKISIEGDYGAAEMEHSHVDEGWIKKWGKRKEPVNFIGQGYLSAAFSAITGEKCGAYQVEEKQSIVSGAQTSKFIITKK